MPFKITILCVDNFYHWIVPRVHTLDVWQSHGVSLISNRWMSPNHSFNTIQYNPTRDCTLKILYFYNLKSVCSLFITVSRIFVRTTLKCVTWFSCDSWINKLYYCFSLFTTNKNQFNVLACYIFSFRLTWYFCYRFFI